MRTLSIHRAQGHAHASDGPEPVTIVIEAPFPTNGAGDSYFHTTDATTLAEALHATLAGGTWGRLVAEMLRLHASKLTTAAAKALIASYGGLAAALKATHPDTGGTAEAFSKVQEARRVLSL